eukprot:TRINITY_DN4551_c0_g1_i1.p1 TRINITY_DN4551_c0_g1~~TRINITY_DN4551_c0_g1_i1.p1  ORF type:complete len:385 (-),score=145.25 TRINITY_DN4551_c0_g1_i1:588-1712(-)
MGSNGVPREREPSVVEIRDLEMSPSNEKAMKAERDPTSTTKSISAMASNVLLAVTIVVINKVLFTKFGFGFAPTLLLTLHQLTCALGAQITAGLNRSCTKAAGAGWGIAAIVLTRVGGNVLVNLSLKYNTVGMYQLFKMLQIPFVFVGEALVLGIPFRTDVALTLAVIISGVVIATVNDLSFSLLGTICGCTAPLAGAMNALTIKHVQTRYDVTGNDLLRRIAPWTVLLQLFLIPITDDLLQLPDWWASSGWLGVNLVLLSCAVAWALEWSLVMVLQYTSAMSTQVLGHVKTMLILLAGVVIFHNHLTPKCATGMAVAFGGVLLYTHVRALDPESAGAHGSRCGWRSAAMAIGAAGVLAIVWSRLPSQVGWALS